MVDHAAQPGLAAALFYRDPKAAYRWLEEAFGFEPAFVLLDEAGELAHSQMTVGGSRLMVGTEWTGNLRSPASVGGINTQSVHVSLPEGADIDAHCATARAAGATIVAEPETQFYGERTYRAADPEGHMFTFSVPVQAMSSDEWDAASGLTTRVRLD